MCLSGTVCLSGRIMEFGDWRMKWKQVFCICVGGKRSCLSICWNIFGNNVDIISKERKSNKVIKYKKEKWKRNPSLPILPRHLLTVALPSSHRSLLPSPPCVSSYFSIYLRTFLRMVLSFYVRYYRCTRVCLSPLIAISYIAYAGTYLVPTLYR